jgi:hypothetical protein
MVFRRKMIQTGPGYRHFRLSIPGEVARALHAANGEDLNLELTETDEGKPVLLIYGDD